MTDFDFDMDNYSITDLQRFFQLPLSFSGDDIEAKMVDIRYLLLGGGHIPTYLVGDFLAFLEAAKTRLFESLPVKHPTSIPPQKINNYPKYLPPPSREENIIPTSSTAFTYTQASDFFTGTLNPIDTRVLKKCISVDSRFRTLPSNSCDFALSLPNRIQKVLSLECTSFEICHELIPSITSTLGNHYLYMNVLTREKEYPHMFLLPNGHYTTSSLLTTLNRLFSEQKYTPFLMLEWMLDPYGSGKCLLMISTEPQDDVYADQITELRLDFSIDLHGHTSSLSKIGNLLGFTKDKYSGKKVYMGESLPNPFAHTAYFFLSIDDFQNRAIAPFEPSTEISTMPPSILARITCLPGQPLQIIGAPRRYFGPVDLSRFQIRLLDAYGRLLDLNSNDYSFCLLLHTVYDL